MKYSYFLVKKELIDTCSRYLTLSFSTFDSIESISLKMRYLLIKRCYFYGMLPSICLPIMKFCYYRVAYIRFFKHYFLSGLNMCLEVGCLRKKFAYNRVANNERLPVLIYLIIRINKSH